jgi:putative resolvase
MSVKLRELDSRSAVCALMCAIVRLMSTLFRTGKAADYLGVTVKTLQRWDREGRLKPERTDSGRRMYPKMRLDAFMGRKAGALAAAPVAYCRVSSAAQKPDLKNQRRALEEFCAAQAIANVEFIEEIGGGLNLRRPKFVTLMDRIEARRVSHLVIAHKDRLVRFGFPWFERFCAEHGAQLLVLNQEQLSPEQEMVQDLLTIVHCFSARLYGLRNYRKKLDEALRRDTGK